MKPSNRMGTFLWLQHTQGRLSWQEKLQLIQKTFLPTTQHILQHLMPATTFPTQLSFKEIVIPDTSYAKEAILHAEQHLTANVLAHSWRSFYWGSAIAIQQQHDFDAEVFLISALFHDLALGKHHPEGCQCFCYHSTLLSQQWAQQYLYPEDRLNLVLDSIALHMNGFEDHHQPIEVRLLQWGTSCDVIGQKLHHLPKNFQKSVFQHFPTQHFHAFMQDSIQFEKLHYPHSRTALLAQLGLAHLITLHQKFNLKQSTTL